LSHCTAPIAYPDFVKYPLSAFIRVWKTVITRGDILIMPSGCFVLLSFIFVDKTLYSGTYHAARNLEPCLSYTRFHLDSIDLMQFLISWIADDAPTIHHREVIWNSAIELIKRVDALVSLSMTQKLVLHYAILP
jgi:hypothetical protein